MTFKPPTIKQARKDFGIFWSKYYQKKGKSDAERWWLKYRPDLSEVMASLELQKQEKDWLESKKKFVADWPHGSTYVHKKRWEDEVGYEFQKYLEKAKIAKAKVERHKNFIRLRYTAKILELDENILKQVYRDNYLSTGYRESLAPVRWLIDELRPEIKGK